MIYADAKKLRKHDTVVRKSDGKRLTVQSIRWEPIQRTIRILCDDGNIYHHRRITR